VLQIGVLLAPRPKLRCAKPKLGRQCEHAHPSAPGVVPAWVPAREPSALIEPSRDLALSRRLANLKMRGQSSEFEERHGIPRHRQAALLQVLIRGPGYGLELIDRVKTFTDGRLELGQGSVYGVAPAKSDTLSRPESAGV
jgi:hypothetical protein